MTDGASASGTEGELAVMDVAFKGGWSLADEEIATDGACGRLRRWCYVFAAGGENAEDAENAMVLQSFHPPSSILP